MKRLSLTVLLVGLVAVTLLAQGRYFLGTGDFRTTEIGADGKTFLAIAPAGTVTARNSASLVGFTLTSTTLTSPTLTGPVLDLPQINDTSDDHQYVFAVSELAADRTVTLPLLTGADEWVFKDHAVTLTNKTLTSPVLNGTLTGTGLTNTALTTPAISGSPTGYGVTQWAQVDITEANILAMNGAPVTVVAGAADEIVEFCGAVLIYDYAGAAYAGGGDVFIQSGLAGAALSNTVAAANSFGSASDKIYALNPLNAAGGYAIGHQSALTITNDTAAFTDPGAAAGVGRLKICYRRWQSGL